MISDLGLDGNRLANCSQMDIKWVHPHMTGSRCRNSIERLSSQGESLSLEYQALTANGSYIWLSDRAKMKQDTAGNHC